MSEYQTLRGQEGDEDDVDHQKQNGDWKENMSLFGKKFGEQLNVVGQKLSEQANVVGDKMKDLFATPTLGEKMVEEATSDVLIGPDWSKNLAICDLVNSGRVPGVDVVRGIKRRLSIKNGHVQLLSLSLLETALKNCSSMFADVSSEKVLDVMVRIVDDPTTPVALREKSLKLIESWGEATEELRYLPVYEETYKSLKARGIVFPPRDAESLVPIFTPPGQAGAAAAAFPGGPAPVHAAPPSYAAAVGTRGVDSAAGMFAYGEEEADVGVRAIDTPQGRVIVLDSKEILSVARNSAELLGTVLTSAPPQEVVKDEVTNSLVIQCKSSKRSVQQLVENESTNETLLFEALTVNDELDKVLEKYTELLKQIHPIISGNQEMAPTPSPAAAAPSIPTPAQPSDQLADLLAPPQALPSGGPPPVTAFSVPSMDHDLDGESLVRNRGGAGGGGGLVTTGSEDDRALAELDAMVFGKSPAPGGSAGQATTGSQGDGKKKEDDLIVF